MWSQPPLLSLHSFTAHLSFGSSWPCGQSTLLSQTLVFGMHIPPPQSNSVARSHRLIGAAERFIREEIDGDLVVLPFAFPFIAYFYCHGLCGLYLLQLTSSLPSEHSGAPEHIKWPGMHVKSLHWNWSSRHVLFWQFTRLSSSPFGQSTPPSHSHCRSMHVSLSLHK